MIAVIGFEDDVTALGLSGVSKIVEVTRSCDVEKLLTHISSCEEGGYTTIFISQKLRELLGPKELKKIKAFFIEIPEEFQTAGLEKIDALARETLGISLDNN